MTNRNVFKKNAKYAINIFYFNKIKKINFSHLLINFKVIISILQIEYNKTICI